jgi:hypothetical protein
LSPRLQAKHGINQSIDPSIDQSINRTINPTKRKHTNEAHVSNGNYSAPTKTNKGYNRNSQTKQFKVPPTIGMIYTE